MRPTRPGVLVTLGVLGAVLVWGLLRVVDARAPLTPPMPWTVPAALAILALGIGVSAVGLRRRLRGSPGARPVDPLAAARMAALAMAASHAGAALAGAYTGVLVFLLPDPEGDVRRERILLALLAVLAAAAVVGAGVFLERVCRVPPPSDDDLPTPAV